MARNRPYQAGIGAMVALALLLAGDRGGWAESVAPAGVGAKPKAKVPEKPADKVAEKGGAKAVAAAPNHVPLPRSRPQNLTALPGTGASAPSASAPSASVSSKE